MINQEYKERVRLLLRIIPIISTEECFAVHGGTAINLSLRSEEQTEAFTAELTTWQTTAVSYTHLTLPTNSRV